MDPFSIGILSSASYIEATRRPKNRFTSRIVQRQPLPSIESPAFSQSTESDPGSRTTYETGYVRGLFNRIAPRYDLLNHVLSSGIDIWWRRKAIRLLSSLSPTIVLDVATGTGDFAFEAARILAPRSVVGVDVAENMLERGMEKAKRKGLERVVTFRHGSAESLPFADGSFDAVCSAFGVRNFSDLDAGLLEMRRVLRPGGAVVILEFSRPHRFPVKQLYRAYSRTVLPVLGGWISRDPEAYRYLPSTIGEFPDGEDFLSHLSAAGFRSARQFPMTFGIATAYDARA